MKYCQLTLQDKNVLNKQNNNNIIITKDQIPFLNNFNAHSRDEMTKNTRVK